MSNKIKSTLNFTKIEHTIFSLPLLFAGAYIGAGYTCPSVMPLFFILLAGIGARILGMSMNRIFDKKIDAQNPRTKNRELATGKMSIKFAIGIALCGLCLYLFACYFLNPLVLILSPVPAIVLIFYSLLKRFTSFCHFGIGLSLSLAPLGAFLAITGTFNFQLDIYLLSIFTFFWISGFDIIYALQDIEFDKNHNVYSMPALLGLFGSQVVAGICHIIAIVLLIILTSITYKGTFVYIPLAIALCSFICAYLPFIPLHKRFFPISAIAGIGGALVIIF